MAKAKAVLVHTEVMSEGVYGTELGEFIEQLQALRKTPGAKYTVETQIEHEYGSEYARFKVTETREENAEEKKARLKQAREDKASRKKADEAEFERLRKKLGK